jgi:putative hydrolase of HD superfamily
MEPQCDIDALLQAHLDAYNRGDVAAFVATFTPDAEIFRHPGAIELRGRDQLTVSYTQLFAKDSPPSITFRVVHRSKLEGHVVDEEAIVVDGRDVAREVSVYQIQSCLIRRIDTIY